MKAIKAPVLILIISLIFLNIGFIFAEEGAPPAEEEEATQPPPQPEVAATQENIQATAENEPETLWLWGEAASVDAQNNEITVKYLDYETDNEKEIKITADSKTKYENAGSLNDVKPSDTVSIDYIITADSKNLAKNISVEKPEEPPVSAAPVAPAAQ